MCDGVGVHPVVVGRVPVAFLDHHEEPDQRLHLDPPARHKAQVLKHTQTRLGNIQQHSLTMTMLEVRNNLADINS